MKIRLGLALLALSVATAAHGQTGGLADSAPRVLISYSELPPAYGEIVREIDDPHTGARWLLMRDPSHPGGPGRLLLVGGFRPEYRPSQPGVEPPRPVIRAGDRLIVEENTAVAEARLEAVALGPAVIGSPLDARLKIGGNVVRVVAVAPGRAAFQPQAEARP
ncbi:MAG: hypothetical protein ABSC47_01615 [Terracidiphilus sp.]